MTSGHAAFHWQRLRQAGGLCGVVLVVASHLTPTYSSGSDVFDVDFLSSFSVNPQCRFRKLLQTDRDRPHQSSLHSQTAELPHLRGRLSATSRERSSIQRLPEQKSQIDQLSSPSNSSCSWI